MKDIFEFFKGIGNVIIFLIDFFIFFVQDFVYIVQLIGEYVVNIFLYFFWFFFVVVVLIVMIFSVVVIYKIMGWEG